MNPKESRKSGKQGRNRLWFLCLYTFCPIALLCLLAYWANREGIRLNLSNSMPRGFYREVKEMQPRVGDWVAACLPYSVAKVGVDRKYLPVIFFSSCPYRGGMVLKKLIAVPGDRLLFSKNHLCVERVDGRKRQSNPINPAFIDQNKRVNIHCYLTPRQKLDQEGRVVKLFGFIQHSVVRQKKVIFSKTHRYWLYGEQDWIHSWDSRYWSGLKEDRLKGVYRPLWIMDKKIG